MDSWIM